ncbi:MAG: Ig-like domain-containing protein [Anaerovoracaceae bacterium]
MNIQKFTKKMLSLTIVFVMLFSVIIQGEPAFAAPTERDKTKITDFTITDQNGAVPSGGFKTSDFVRMSMTWDASIYDNTLKEGDYFFVTLPKEFRFPQDHDACNFNITAPNGTDVVAKAVVTSTWDEGGGSIKVSFTNYVEDKYNIKGTMYLNANFNEDKISGTGNHEISVSIGSFSKKINVPTTPAPPQNPLVEEVFTKWSGQSLSAEGYVHWAIRINHKKANFSNVVISDQLTAENGDMDGIHYVEDSFDLWKVEMDEYGNEQQGATKENISDKIVFNPEKTSFTYNMGAINDGQQYKLRYKTTYKPGLKLKNKAKFEGDSNIVTVEKFYIIANSGGQGQGDLTSKIKIVKLDSEKNEIKLPNAKFQITNTNNGNTITLTTNSNGEAISDKLIPGKYKIKETEAPAGYMLSEEEYYVDVTSNGECIKEIKNIPIRTPGTSTTPKNPPKDEPKTPPAPPTDNPKIPPKSPNIPGDPGSDIPDDGVPIGSKTINKTPSNVKNVNIVNDLVPNAFISNITDNRPKLPQTGQNFRLIELLSLIGLLAVSTGIVMNLRSGKRN